MLSTVSQPYDATSRTSVKATAKPILLLSLGLAKPRTRRRIEYATSWALRCFRPSDFGLSPSSSSSSEVSGESFGTNCDWKCSSAATSFTDASSLSFFFAEDRCQNSGSVVDMADDELRGRTVRRLRPAQTNARRSGKKSGGAETRSGD